MASMQLSENLDQRQKEISSLQTLILRYYELGESKNAESCEQNNDKESKDPDHENDVLFAIIYL